MFFYSCTSPVFHFLFFLTRVYFHFYWFYWFYWYPWLKIVASTFFLLVLRVVLLVSAPFFASIFFRFSFWISDSSDFFLFRYCNSYDSSFLGSSIRLLSSLYPRCKPASIEIISTSINPHHATKKSTIPNY